MQAHVTKQSIARIVKEMSGNTIHSRKDRIVSFDALIAVSSSSNASMQVGSGFDVSAAIYGTHTYTRFSPSALADALSAGDTPQNIHQDSPEAKAPLVKIAECVGARGGWDAERGQLRLPPCFRLLMGDVCGGSSTPSMVRKVGTAKKLRYKRWLAFHGVQTDFTR